MEPLLSGIRQMRQYRFLLDVSKKDQQELAHIIQELKAKRSFARAIRTGLRLFWSLMQGQTDVLVEEFPWVVERLQSPLVQLQEQLDRIETKITVIEPPRLGSGGSVAPIPPQLSQLGNKLMPDPLDFDDARFETTVVQAQTTENLGANFRISMGKMNGEKGLVSLTLDDIEYGIATQQIPPHILELKRARMKTPPLQAKPIANADLKLSKPDLDDLEIDW